MVNATDFLATHFIYKCRACGTYFSKGYLPTFEEADRELLAISNVSTNGGASGSQTGLRILGSHETCHVLKKGIADLIGIGSKPGNM